LIGPVREHRTALSEPAGPAIAACYNPRWMWIGEPERAESWRAYGPMRKPRRSPRSMPRDAVPPGSALWSC